MIILYTGWPKLRIPIKDDSICLTDNFNFDEYFLSWVFIFLLLSSEDIRCIQEENLIYLNEDTREVYLIQSRDVSSKWRLASIKLQDLYNSSEDRELKEVNPLSFLKVENSYILLRKNIM